MNNTFVILESIMVDCPLCNESHLIEKRTRTTQALVKDVLVNYDEIYYFCPKSSEEDECEFVPAEVLDFNLLNARNAYRASKHLLTSTKIAFIRKQYTLTQSEFSALLGWGEVTIARYETKNIQDETYDKLMRMVGENPAFALKTLKDHRDRFQPERLIELKRVIQDKIAEVALPFMNKQEIVAQYSAFDEPTEINGFRLLDLNRLESMVAYFAIQLGHVFKIKLMKLLWYADALSFMRYGKAISGLVYRHETFGALPIASRNIIYLPNLIVEEQECDEQTRYSIQANECDLSCFTQEEELVLSEVVQHFGNQDTKNIVDCMHEEDAYEKTQMYDIISFSLCKTLKAFSN